MIKGSATLELNEETVKQAVEDYLNESLKGESMVTVLSVKPATAQSGYSTATTFKVELQRPEKPLTVPNTKGNT